MDQSESVTKGTRSPLASVYSVAETKTIGQGAPRTAATQAIRKGAPF
jgi:hypothetical protein